MNFLKYLTISPQDTELGLFITNTGFNTIKPHDNYPFSEHPIGYLFDWNKGRVLDEFQINYIAEGKGVFESASGKKLKVNPGSIILVFPNEWHRYKPEKKTGWKEYWIGFKGSIAYNMENLNFISKRKPVIKIGFNETVFNLYKSLIEVVIEEKPGFQLIASGILMQIIGQVNEVESRKYFDKDEIEENIQRAKIKLVEKLDETISPQLVADTVNMSYSSFRKIFKRYVGLSPRQYQMQSKITKSKELLCLPDLRIKDITYMLGFESCSHFSKIFKEKTNLSPSQFRDMSQGKELKKGHQ